MGLGVGVRDGLGRGVAVGVGVGVGVEVGAGDGTSVGAGVGMGVDPSVEAGAGDGTSVGAGVGMGVDPSVEAGAGDGTSVGAGVGMGVDPSVEAGASDGTSVGAAAGVGVNSGMEVGDGDACGIGVGVAAAVGVSSTTAGTSVGARPAHQHRRRQAGWPGQLPAGTPASYIPGVPGGLATHQTSINFLAGLPGAIASQSRRAHQAAIPSRTCFAGMTSWGDPKRDCPVVEGDLDAVGVVTWQHPLGAPCLWLVLCFQTTIPEAREHFFTPSTRCHTHPFGGLGVGPPLATWWDEIKSLHYQVHSGVVTKSPFPLIGREVCVSVQS